MQYKQTQCRQDWCRSTGAALLAVQPPGRALRAREPPAADLRSLAAALLPVAAPRLARARRYFVVGHSLGAWAAFEFVRLARARGKTVGVVGARGLGVGAHL